MALEEVAMAAETAKAKLTTAKSEAPSLANQSTRGQSTKKSGAKTGSKSGAKSGAKSGTKSGTKAKPKSGESQEAVEAKKLAASLTKT